MVNDLIDVKYTDRTAYTDIASGDVMGCPFEYHWGPVDELQVLSRSEFYDLYPESLPNGYTGDLSRYFGYAQIKQAFSFGMPEVEVIRPQGDWAYEVFKLTGSTPSAISQVPAADPFSTQTSGWLYVSSKYPGYLPKSLVDPYDSIAVQVLVSSDATVFTVKVLGIKNSTITAVIEEFEGNGIQGSTLDGAKYYIDDVCANSRYIKVKFDASFTGTKMGHTSSTYTSFLSVGETISGVAAAYPSELNASDYRPYFDDYYADFFVSNATLLISPISTNQLDADIFNIAQERQSVTGVVGYPIVNTFSKSDIQTYIASGITGASKNQFTFFVAGREIVSVFGSKIASNCVGGFCGCTAAVARSARLNQLASAFSYGSYAGSISETLKMKDANDLMKDGVISVIATRNGNYIWGTRNTYTRTTSMFARANVTRVVANLLRNAFPIALDAIHTDAAANVTERSRYQTRFSTVINDLIANGNLQPQSEANCMGNINSDYNTQGGRIFNVIFTCYFIGLVEKVVINIVATDSSVTANIQ